MKTEKKLVLFTKFVIHNGRGEPYLIRYILIRTPWFALYVHKILQSDDDRDCHDHPADFWSLILKGRYTEQTFAGESRDVRHIIGRDGQVERTEVGPTHTSYNYREFTVLDINKKRAEDLHRLDLNHGPVWSLLWSGRKRRDWGFMTDEGWVDHNTYLDRKFGPNGWRSV